MSKFSVYDGVAAYAKAAIMELYIGCKTSIFNNPANQIYSIKGESTKIRQYAAPNASDYDKNKGWTGGASGGSVRWIDYRAPYDRMSILSVDAIDEEQSFVTGMTPSIQLLFSDFVNNRVSREIDATNIATWFSRVPAKNRHVNTDASYSTDVDHILGTLNKIRSDIFNSGYDGQIVLFISPDAYNNLQTAIINKNGLASGVMLAKKASVYVDSGIDTLDKDETSVLEATIDFEAFGKFIVIQVPADRMYTAVTMLDGTSVGQEQGGIVPDIENTGFGTIDLLAIPLNAAFTNTRYIVNNYLFPATFLGQAIGTVDVRKLNEKMFGPVRIDNAGINQKANAFEIDSRIIYGGDIFDNRAKNCVAVTGALGAKKKVTGITVTDQGGTNKVKVGATLNLETAVTPTDAYDKTVDFSIENGTGTASVTDGGVVTGIKAGSVTAKATATDGSGVSGTLALTVEE